MKRSGYWLFTAGIKTVSAILVMFFLCFFTVVHKAKDAADDIWKQLGLAQPQAHTNINYSFTNGHLQYFGAKNAKNIALGDRVAVVNQLVAYAKKYVASPEFKTAYKTFRTKMKPAEREATMPAVSVASIKAEEKARLEENLKVAEEGLKSTNPKIKNSAPARIEGIKKQIAALDEPNNATIKRRLDEAARMSSAIANQHTEAMQKFESKYPEDPQVLLKKRLQEIIDITADVDYAAELKEGYKGKKVFVNPDYEKKPAEWKLGFRAGKASTDAVRAAAQQWLRELNQTAAARH